MRSVIIENTGAFRLDSIGNGAAYTMTDKRTGEERSAQFGDDAAAFRAEYEAIEAAHANPASAWHRKPWDACLAYLFADCLAAPEDGDAITEYYRDRAASGLGAHNGKTR